MTDLITQPGLPPLPRPVQAPVVAGSEGPLPWYKKEFHLGKAVKPEELMNFSRQCSSFLRAGIPVLDALAVLSEENSNKAMVEVLATIGRDLRSGMSLGAAIGQHPRVFPNYYIAMVRSAELTGRLDGTLDQLAGYLERDIEARRKVRGAMTYPGVVFVMAMGAVVILATFVMPRFKALFENINAELPLTTRLLLGFTTFVGTWWWAILLGIGLVLSFLYVAFGGSHGQKRRHQLLLRAPGIGPLMHFVILERFCRVLAAMVQAGVTLPDALAVASDATNNRVYQDQLVYVRTEMLRGAGFARPIAATGLFPPAARQMIRVGESTGTLDKQLESTAAFYERELTYKLKRFTDLFEPMVIVGVGLVVGFVAVALVQAMYGVFDQVQA